MDLKQCLRFLGFNPGNLIMNLRETPRFLFSLQKFKKQQGGDKAFPICNLNPSLTDRLESAGTMSGHYFHQDYYVAKRIFNAKPIKHIDIGSRIDGFVSHVAVFRSIEVLDIRDLKSTIKNIVFRKADLMSLPQDLISSCDSISSLHALEHFGLGRYGDPVDYFGFDKAFLNITKILKPGGIFYFSVPIGPQRVEFNAHRVFAVKELLKRFEHDFVVENVSYVNDAGEFFESVELSKENINRNFDCRYGCGIFELRKNLPVIF